MFRATDHWQRQEPSKMQSLDLAVFFYVIMSVLGAVHGHGRLLNPPGRSSMWRFGFNTPKNYDDNQLFCGGFSYQQNLGGKCGVCGDPYDQSRENEAGGKYATGVISKHYTMGSTIVITVQITSNHLGFFEFRLCENNDVTKAITQECLKHLLVDSTTGETRHQIGTQTGHINITVNLPVNVTCSQCVIQWRYHTGNSWGRDENGVGDVGNGPQEEFYACSDIAIYNRAVVNTATPTTATPTTATPTVSPTTATPTVTPTTATPAKATPTTTITTTTTTNSNRNTILSSIFKSSTSRKPPSAPPTTQRTITEPTTTQTDTTTRTTQTDTTTRTTQAPSIISSSRSCVAIDTRTTDTWCDSNCNHVPAHCPSDFCHCS